MNRGLFAVPVEIVRYSTVHGRYTRSTNALMCNNASNYVFEKYYVPFPFLRSRSFAISLNFDR